MAPKSFYDKGIELTNLLPNIVDPQLQGITREAIREYYKADVTLGVKSSPLLISLHGVMTRGKWQKDLTPILNDAGLTHIPLDYGFFFALLFVLPILRSIKVRWFRNEYTHITEKYPNRTPSLIAHSFGTYIIARAMELYSEIKFDYIILCGSIVRRDSGWTTRHTSGQMNRVLNECGRKDWVVRVAAWAAKDANPSGVYGFKDSGAGNVHQRTNYGFRHSDYLYDLNFRTNWVPFLVRGDLPNDIPRDSISINWRFYISFSVFILIVVALILKGAC